MNICKCGGKLSAAIGWPSERRYVCYKCGATVRVESYCEDATDPAEPPPTEQRPPVPPPSRSRSAAGPPPPDDPAASTFGPTN